MGKKNSTFKNVMVTLGCGAFAGVVVIGGGYIASSCIGDGNTMPAWLDKVEIRVNEQNAVSASSDNKLHTETIEQNHSGAANADVSADGDYAGKGTEIGGGGKPDPDLDNVPQEPRFKDDEDEKRKDEDVESETETEKETEAETETETEKETESESEEESTTEADEDSEKNKTDKKDKKDTEDKKESRRKPVEVDHVQTIDQETLSSAVIADVTQVVKVAMPCVVSITNEYTAYDYWYDEEYDEEANGSGIIVAQSDEELLIVTNYHVVEDNNNLFVQFNDDKEAVAYVKGQSPENDLAVLTVFLDDVSDETLENIAIAALGDSDSLQVGEPAIAIGDSLGYGQSVTTGVISALNRDVFADDPEVNPGYLIQTDAAINPGNSGGALLNVRGEVIGINSSKIADYVIEGMGYAIPISTAKPIIDDLMQKETRKKVPLEERAFLGIAGTDVTEDAVTRYEMPEGVYVSNVLEDTAAEQAGILKGDIITYIDGEKLEQMDQLQNLLEYYAAGTEIEIVIMRQRDGEYRQQTIDVTLGAKED